MLQLGRVRQAGSPSSRTARLWPRMMLPSSVSGQGAHLPARMSIAVKVTSSFGQHARYSMVGSSHKVDMLWSGRYSWDTDRSATYFTIEFLMNTA